jgi:hypothetical protein
LLLASVSIPSAAEAEFQCARGSDGLKPVPFNTGVCGQVLIFCHYRHRRLLPPVPLSDSALRLSERCTYRTSYIPTGESPHPPSRFLNGSKTKRRSRFSPQPVRRRQLTFRILAPGRSRGQNGPGTERLIRRFVLQTLRMSGEDRPKSSRVLLAVPWRGNLPYRTGSQPLSRPTFFRAAAEIGPCLAFRWNSAAPIAESYYQAQCLEMGRVLQIGCSWALDGGFALRLTRFRAKNLFFREVLRDFGSRLTLSDSCTANA